MSWSEKYKRSIDCDNPKGFSQRAHCQGRKKKLKEQLKPFKSVEQIAKKHRLDVSFIQRQLDMGEPIEHEHTKDHKLAMEIALQHLDEIPDYYTRLKKMEASAKKEHKKFKDVKEHCGCEDNAVEELEDQLKDLKDTSYDSIDKLMRRIMKKHDMTAKQLHNAFVDKNGKTPDDWIEDLEEGTLHHWFRGSRSKGGKPGWVQADGSPCANEPGETKTPKCFSSGRLKSLKRKGKKGLALIKSAVRRKRQKDKGQQAKSGAAAPTNVPTFAKGKKDPNYVKAEPGIKEAMELNEAKKDKPGKGSGTKDACYHKVKARYDVWPSAYASGALVKCRKVGADNWGNQSEETQMIRYCPKCQKDETRSECKYGPKYWDMFSIPSSLTGLSANQIKYDPNRPHPANEAYDHEYSMARSELSTIIAAAKRLKKKIGKGEGSLEAWVQSKITKAADYIDTAADYVDSGEMSEGIIDTLAAKVGPVIDKGVNAVFGKPKVTIKEPKVTPPPTPGYPNKAVPEPASNRFLRPDPSPSPTSSSSAQPQQKNYGNVGSVGNVGGNLRYVMDKAKERNKILNQQNSYQPEGDLIDEAGKKCWTGYKKKGTQELFGKKYNRCVKEGYSNWREELGLTEDWQKVNRQDKTDGLSQKAVDAYRRENPGSKLQTAVTEKKPTGKRAKRRASFCRRMKGMKSKLTSAKTARDPDSRINKALRRWNCN